MSNCAKCGAELQASATVCEYCGSAVETPRPSPSAGMGNSQAYEPSGEVLRFKRSSIVGMIFCSIFTLGLYFSVWYWLRKDAIKALDPAQSQKTDKLIKGCVAVHIIYWVFLVILYDLEVASLLWLCWIGAFIYLAFVMRGLMRSYAARVSPQSPLIAYVAPSVLWTVVFQIFYLQTHINRMIDARLLDAKL
jgi:hypothetical protein